MGGARKGGEGEGGEERGREGGQESSKEGCCVLTSRNAEDAHACGQILAAEVRGYLEEQA